MSVLQGLTQKERAAVLPVTRQEMEQLEERWALDGDATIADIRSEGKTNQQPSAAYINTYISRFYLSVSSFTCLALSPYIYINTYMYIGIEY